MLRGFAAYHRDKMKQLRTRARRMFRGRFGDVSNGVILYEGPSQLDPSQDIVVIATGLNRPSKNDKTDDMIQVWILLQDVAPTKANQQGLDVAVCGDCKHRQWQRQDDGSMAKVGSCYVVLHNAPLSVYKAYKRGNYPWLDPESARELLRDTWVRFGAYGDPSAVPVHIWEPIRDVVRKYTGYTHQWRNLGPEWHWLMASVDTPAERLEAMRMGWRYFRVKGEDDELFDNEQVCASEARGTSCAACGLCAGMSTAKAKSQVITVHGVFAGNF